MSSIFYSKKLRYLGREYLFQTTYNESDRSVVCSLFNEGKLLDIHYKPVPGHPEGNGLVDYIMDTHLQILNHYETLLKVAESKKDSERSEVIVKLGSALLTNRLYDEAIDLLNTAARKHNDDSAIRLLLGKVYKAKNRFEDAEAELKKAVELSPNYPDFRNLLGETYLRLRKPLAAINEFKKAAEFNVYYDRAFYNIGLGYILNGIVKEDFELAKNLQEKCDETFGKAITFNPRYDNENYRIGMAFLHEGRLDEAYDKLFSAIENSDADRSFGKLLDLYIRCVYGDVGATEENIKDYIGNIENLLKTNPGFADLENELGMAYTIMGKIMRDKAIDHFKRAIEINPNFNKAIKNIKLSENDLRGFEALLEAILK
ncbi:MAG: tetratricopeptide repeat protein [Candidatus Zixiibacteriota bacterium]|nr:MAG: tetratricopeptide repeat protein [candidate division Zixibacteria bacterium]